MLLGADVDLTRRSQVSALGALLGVLDKVRLCGGCTSAGVPVLLEGACGEVGREPPGMDPVEPSHCPLSTAHSTVQPRSQAEAEPTSTTMCAQERCSSQGEQEGEGGDIGATLGITGLCELALSG